MRRQFLLEVSDLRRWSLSTSSFDRWSVDEQHFWTPQARASVQQLHPALSSRSSTLHFAALSPDRNICLHFIKNSQYSFGKIIISLHATSTNLIRSFSPAKQARIIECSSYSSWIDSPCLIGHWGFFDFQRLKLKRFASFARLYFTKYNTTILQSLGVCVLLCDFVMYLIDPFALLFIPYRAATQVIDGLHCFLLQVGKRLVSKSACAKNNSLNLLAHTGKTITETRNSANPTVTVTLLVF